MVLLNLENWAESLNESQLRVLTFQLVKYLVEIDEVRLKRVPYWISTGDPLVEGQNPFSDEDES